MQSTEARPIADAWEHAAHDVRQPMTDHHTFLFADLAGYTSLTEAMGDEEAAALAGDFGAKVRELAPDYGAEAVKAIGDAMMLRGQDAAGAIRLGIAVVNDVGGQHFFPTVRVGMHSGPAIERGGDWFGATVNVAARVSGVAGGGEVLLTEATRAAAGALDSIDLVERGMHALRNVGEPVKLYAARGDGERDEAGLPIDPICHMAVDPGRAAGTLVHAGREYHFCSLGCAQQFAAAPQRHVATDAATGPAQ